MRPHDVPLTPQPTGKPPEPVDVGGLLFAVLADETEFAFMWSEVEPDVYYLPLFKTVEDLGAWMERLGHVDFVVKRIRDGSEFLRIARGHPEIRVIVDLRIEPSTGMVRFCRVFTGGIPAHLDPSRRGSA